MYKRRRANLTITDLFKYFHVPKVEGHEITPAPSNNLNNQRAIAEALLIF